MRLILEYDRTLTDPGPDDIGRALAGLRFPDDKFAILESRPQHFIQTHCREDGSLSLEVRIGGPELHYDVEEGSSVPAVTEAFLDYLAGDNAWLTGFEWQPLNLDPQAHQPGPAPYPHPGLPPGVVTAVTDATYPATVAGDATVLLAFLADGDSGSRALRGVLDTVAREHAHRLSVAAVDVATNPDTVDEWGITTLPTLVLLHAGTMRRVLLGVRPAARLIEEIDEVLPVG